MSDVVLEAKGLTKIYNPFTPNAVKALDNISFGVESGDFVAIMGPSGSGKSTLINTLSTIDLPTKGRVFIENKNVFAMGANEIGRFRFEHLGFIFQDFNLLDTHTLFENIALPLTLKKVDSKEVKERVFKIAEKMHIDGLLHKYPQECSGGQRQRAAICRALINNPKIIVADEPTGNLDSANSASLMEIFQSLNQEGVTIVMVTHDPLICSYAKCLVYLRDGHIENYIEKGSMSQNEFFDQIVEINAKESRQVIR